MLRLQLTHKQKKRSSTLLALAQSEFEAALKLTEFSLFKEAVVHLYFTCFYTSQALLVQHIGSNPSHKQLKATLHKRYGRNSSFPRKYIELHSRLHETRLEYDYKNTYSPDPDEINKELKRLGRYVHFALRVVPRIEINEIIKGIFLDNKKIVQDFSYDLYCPKTYKHHTRITVWQPPFYLDIFSVKTLRSALLDALKRMKVKNSINYVIGLNSRLDQYCPKHLIMLDIDSVNSAVEKALATYGGILLKSGRGFHFIGKKIAADEKEWHKMLQRLRTDKVLRKHIDHDHIAISLQRGYSTLRISANHIKPNIPYFYKEV